MGEYIFVNVDPANIALEAFNKLTGKEIIGRSQYCKVQNIISAKKARPNIFGKEAVSHPEWASAFGNRASALFRMVMLCAVGVDKRHWPKTDVFDAHYAEGEVFEDLLGVNDEGEAYRYWSKYGQVFTPYIIADKVLKKITEEVQFDNTMLIFREEFRECIQIKTNASAKMYRMVEGDRNFEGKVRVECARYTINCEKENEHFRIMKEVIEKKELEEKEEKAKEEADRQKEEQEKIGRKRKRKEEVDLEKEKTKKKKKKEGGAEQQQGKERQEREDKGEEERKKKKKGAEQQQGPEQQEGEEKEEERKNEKKEERAEQQQGEERREEKGRKKEKKKKKLRRGKDE